MGEFRSILIEGIFSEKGGSLIATRNDGVEVIVEQVVAQLEGEEVQVIIHHLPPHPVQPERWGGGCCYWEPSGRCPAGHHKQPGFLLNISGEGILKRSDGEWWLQQSDGGRLDLPIKLLEGHSSRVVATTVFDIEKMKATLADHPDLGTLGIQADNLRNLMQQLQRFVDPKEGE